MAKRIWSPEEELEFQSWYARTSKIYRLNPNPDDPRHHYDYRAAYKAGIRRPDVTGHWPSKYKTAEHPRRYIKGIDTIKGVRANKEVLRNQ